MRRDIGHISKLCARWMIQSGQTSCALEIYC